jgi:hypothetical protein
MSPIEKAMALAAVSGLKVALGPAFLGASQRRPWASACVLAAVGEILLDKLGVLPSRSRLPLLIPRALAGAWVAHESLREDGQPSPGAAVLGAAVAAGAATVAPLARRALGQGLGIPDALVAVAEDGLALGLASRATELELADLPRLIRESAQDVMGPLQNQVQRAGIGGV